MGTDGHGYKGEEIDLVQSGSLKWQWWGLALTRARTCHERDPAKARGVGRSPSPLWAPAPISLRPGFCQIEAVL
jgi:hypothetical protein